MDLSSKISELKEKAMRTLEQFLLSCLSSSDARSRKRGSLLCYWIIDYIRFLQQEQRVHTFRIYKRGTIVSVHLGYRIGSEEGGMHYGVVLNKKDSSKNPVLTIVPLTSLKSAEQIQRLKPGCVFLGSDLLKLLMEKHKVAPSPALANEINKLKWGSIALPNQIVTISKLRIYGPISKDSPLYGIRFSSESLDEIDRVIQKMFIHA